MRCIRADPMCAWVRFVVGPSAYWRAWLGLAQLLMACGFPYAMVGWLISSSGPAAAGYRRLYLGNPGGRHAA